MIYDCIDNNNTSIIYTPDGTWVDKGILAGVHSKYSPNLVHDYVNQEFPSQACWLSWCPVCSLFNIDGKFYQKLGKCLVNNNAARICLSYYWNNPCTEIYMLWDTIIRWLIKQHQIFLWYQGISYCRSLIGYSISLIGDRI